MKYVDTGARDVEQSVAWWMQKVAAEGPCEFRCQSGYFALEGSTVLLSALEDWAQRGSLMRVVLGSNRASTLASHVSYLAGRLGLPRPHIGLGIVSFDGALFHPKVYHFRRADGSEAAYVGSANFTGPGVSGLNVEAGIVIDTREGDDPNILQSIRQRIDAWFDAGQEGVNPIGSPDDIQRLLEEGYLSLRAIDPPDEAGLASAEKASSGPQRARRTPLFRLARIDKGADQREAQGSQTPNSTAPEDKALEKQRFLRHTEASFHYPQGTHLGHILAVLWRFYAGREGTPFDDEYIRLSGSLGAGRIAGFRRQIKYKLLAAMELGLLTDIRGTDDPGIFIPDLTELGRTLWELIAPHIDTDLLVMGVGDDQSTTLPKPPAFYNEQLRRMSDESAAFGKLYGETMLAMPAVGQMLDYLGQFPDDRVSKDEIYRGFFAFPHVIAFCDSVGIDPQTEESARHRCPFLLNILESLGKVDQERSHVVRR